ncbi:RnfH family protein [Polaromonas sp. C04]|uniref:RnfH family protein n=1 Tax=Polaromonas sp. C04 TaxID=1945857 RepID=UPI00098644C1|nr:RnfH family protein [Polaromonas sp. C04]OOG57496.1 RnfH family protein [Polaromonas sp. C04]
MTIRVSIVYSSGPRHTHEQWVTLEDGASVLQALQISGVLQAFPGIGLAHASVGVWSRKAGLNQLLREHDRVEVYRPLTVDPKVARRERFRKQGAKAAGLFAKKRSGAKAGY